MYQVVKRDGEIAEFNVQKMRLSNIFIKQENLLRPLQLMFLKKLLRLMQIKFMKDKKNTIKIMKKAHLIEF